MKMPSYLDAEMFSVLKRLADFHENKSWIDDYLGKIIKNIVVPVNLESYHGKN